MFRGTKDTPPGMFSRLVAQNGGRDNAFTGEDYTAYHQTVALDIVRRPKSLITRPSPRKTFSETVCGPLLKLLARNPVWNPGAMFCTPG